MHDTDKVSQTLSNDHLSHSFHRLVDAVHDDQHRTQISHLSVPFSYVRDYGGVHSQHHRSFHLNVVQSKYVLEIKLLTAILRCSIVS